LDEKWPADRRTKRPYSSSFTVPVAVCKTSPKRGNHNLADLEQLGGAIGTRFGTISLKAFTNILDMLYCK